MVNSKTIIAFWEKTNDIREVQVYDRSFVSANVVDVNNFLKSSITEVSSIRIYFSQDEIDYTLGSPVFEIFRDDFDWFGGISIFRLNDDADSFLLRKCHFLPIRQPVFDPVGVIKSEYYIISKLDFEQYWGKFYALLKKPNFFKSFGSKYFILRINHLDFSMNFQKNSPINSKLANLFNLLYSKKLHPISKNGAISIELAYSRSFYDFFRFTQNKVQGEIERLGLNSESK